MSGERARGSPTSKTRPKSGLVITIDGPSGTGKSTAARNLARKLGLIYLDTGAMYRAVGLKALRQNVPFSNKLALSRLAAESRIKFVKAGAGKMRLLLDGKDVSQSIRRPEVSVAASKVAVVPGVRRALVKIQKQMGREGGIVAEGRDTGTVVFPKAPFKFFLTADPEERARRRYEELKASGHRVKFSQVLKESIARDKRDVSRNHSPLRPAEGAIQIDNTLLKPPQVLGILVAYVRRAKRSVRNR